MERREPLNPLFKLCRHAVFFLYHFFLFVGFKRFVHAFARGAYHVGEILLLQPHVNENVPVFPGLAIACRKFEQSF